MDATGRRCSELGLRCRDHEEGELFCPRVRFFLVSCHPHPSDGFLTLLKRQLFCISRIGIQTVYNVFLSRRLRAAQFTERQIRMELFPLVFSFIQPSGRSFPKQQATNQTKKEEKKEEERHHG